jgi:hypothetical protein
MDQEVPLPNVSSKILAKVIEYCKYHVDADKTGEDGAAAVKEEDSKAWDTEFVKVDQGTLFELILVRRNAPVPDGAPCRSLACSSDREDAPLSAHATAQAANFLNIKQLLDLTCLTVANMIKGACAPRDPSCAHPRATLYRGPHRNALAARGLAPAAACGARDREADACRGERCAWLCDVQLGLTHRPLARHSLLQARRRRRSARPSTSRTTSLRCVAARCCRAALLVCAPIDGAVLKAPLHAQEEEEEVRRENQWAFE